MGGQLGVLLARTVLGPIGGAGLGAIFIVLGMFLAGAASLAISAAVGALIGWRVGDSVSPD